MQKFYLPLLFSGLFGVCQAQDMHVKCVGKVLSQKDSSTVSASLLYEKLPYYDDMGMMQSDEEGQYTFYLVDDTEYNFKVTKEGFKPLTQQMVIADADGDGIVRADFYIEPDAEPELITLEDLIFSRGSDQISESSFRGLDELVLWLNERPGMVIRLEGHTDFAGNAEANMRLSEARVEAVKEYLVKQGIKKNRVQTMAFGGTQPLSEERTDEAKTRNRRVEVRVIRK